MLRIEGEDESEAQQAEAPAEPEQAPVDNQ
jgi:hypothetical protein